MIEDLLKYFFFQLKDNQSYTIIHIINENNNVTPSDLLDVLEFSLDPFPLDPLPVFEFPLPFPFDALLLLAQLPVFTHCGALLPSVYDFSASIKE